MTKMDSFKILGGNKISGTFTPRGNKNAALPMIAASLLTDEEVIISNVPRIRDVGFMLDLIGSVGAEWSWLDDHQLRIKSSRISNTELDINLCKKIRASILLAGPLLARCGEVKIPPPGGDVIGRRRLDTHFQSFASMGISYRMEGNYYCLKADRGLQPSVIFLDEPSVTGTENALMASAGVSGEVVIKNAASEPHIQDLCTMLSSMGVKIAGSGTNNLVINGNKTLKGTTVRVCSDHIEIGSLIALAAITRSDLTIEPVKLEYIQPIVFHFKRLGIEVQIDQNKLVVNSNQSLDIKPDIGNAIPTLADGPWPSFPADLTSIALVIATQAKGTVLIFEKMFESRMFFVDKLVSMGAKIVLCDPHRAVVVGPSKLSAQHLSSPDIRAGMALLIAASIAEGESIIDNAHQIDRGYESLDVRLAALGLDITRI